MSQLVYRALGRLSLALDPVRTLLRGHRRKRPADPGRDRTGILVRQGRPLEVLWSDDEILYVRYDSVAHSFWRAQELSLFRRHLPQFASPVLDFGSGDGSFASALFSHVNIAADTDPDALALANTWGIYGRIVHVTGDSIPLPDRSVASVISNSVLEHVSNLERMLAELARVIRPGGVLAFTVPLQRYSEHLAFYFGSAASRRVNQESSHYNLLDESQWLAHLEHYGFRAVVVQQYQPDRFTFWYRMLRLLGPRGLGAIPGLQAAAWKHIHQRLVEMVRESVRGTRDGANLFVIARRSPDSAGGE